MLISLSLAFMLALTTVQDGAAVRQSEADFARGVELQQRGDLEGARAAYEAALRGLPDRADALSNLGIAYFKTEEFEQAAAELARVAAAQPSNYQARLLLGLSYFQLNKLPEA